MKPPRILLLAVLLEVTALAALAASGPASTSTPVRPNIMFILADDLGYMDYTAYAARPTGEKPAAMDYETPNLDRLSAGGL